MDKHEAVINFLLNHKDLAILLISRLYPLDAEMLKKYRDKLEKQETDTSEGGEEEYVDSDPEGRWDEDDNLHEYGCSCSECEELRLKDLEAEKARTPEDDYRESAKFIEETKNDWIFLGPWQEELEKLMDEFGMVPYEGVGSEIWEKMFKPVLDDNLVGRILD